MRRGLLRYCGSCYRFRYLPNDIDNCSTCQADRQNSRLMRCFAWTVAIFGLGWFFL